MESKPKRIWVTGAEGFVGRYVVTQLQGKAATVIGTAFAPSAELEQLDITSSDQIAHIFQEISATDMVIHAAAQANVDWCEEHPAKSAQVNLKGTQDIADIVAQAKARLIFLSSEYVFDGMDGPYREEDVPAPRNVYGQQKLAAEQYIAAHVTNHLIVRTTTVFGYELAEKNFLMSLLRRLRTEAEVWVPVDQFSTPTYVVDLANILADLATRNDVRGILNVAGPERMSRFEFARHIADVFKLPDQKLHGVSTQSLNQIAQRPLQAGLRIDRLKSLGYTVTQEQEALHLLMHAYGNNIGVH